MQLINAIVSQPDDLDFRLHLRNEFMRTGMIDGLEVKCLTANSHGRFMCFYRCDSTFLIGSSVIVMFFCIFSYLYIFKFIYFRLFLS